MAEWKAVDGFPNFSISNEGKLMYKQSDGSSEIEWPVWTAGRVSLRDENGNSSKPLYIHRLVAEHFVECNLTDNPVGWYYVKHIDGDKNNNRADNLYWSVSTHGSTSMQRRRPRQLKTTVTIRHDEERLSLVVYARRNGKT